MLKLQNLKTLKNPKKNFSISFLQKKLLRPKTEIFEKPLTNIHYIDQYLYNKTLKFFPKLRLLFSLKDNGQKNIFSIILTRRDFPTLAIFSIFSCLRIFINIYLFSLVYKFSKKIFLTQKIDQKTSKIKFEDIVGIDEFKEELEDIILYLKNRKKFKTFGGNIPKGVLLNGPPGCGKTQLARAVAGETNLPFYQFNASDFVQPLYGEGEKILKNLFSQARRSKKGAIIFIDEIDSLAQRSDFMTSGNSLINQLLTEMDGFQGEDNILIIAATNRAESLDKALTRSG